MAAFEPAFKRVVWDEEGGPRLSNDAADPGGLTKWGITLRAAQVFWGKDRVTPAFMRNLSEEDARAFYSCGIWEPHRLSCIESQVAATKVFSALVNMGTNGARCAQRAAGCADDGVLGPVSLAAINAKPDFVAAMGREMETFYRALVARRPSSAKFLNGWLARAAWKGP